MCKRVVVFLIGVTCALPLTAVAQVPSSTITGNAGGSQTTLSPQTPAYSTDIIHVNTVGPGIPLKHGAIVFASETVYLNGVLMTRGADYQLDCIAGAIYLLRQQTPGQVVVITYKYIPAYQPSNQNPHAAPITRSYKPLNYDMNLGMDWGSDYSFRGAGASSNLLGGATNFQIGPVSTTGAYLVGASPIHGFAGDDSGRAQLQTSDQFVVEKLQTKLKGGTIELDYQDVSPGFSRYSEVNRLGFSTEDVNKLQKEAGLKRFGFAMSDLQIGSAKLSSSYKTVTDGSSPIDWKSFSLTNGPFSFAYSSRHVGENFSRFDDLSDADRQDLANEVGLTRDSLKFDYKAKFGELNFTANDIADSGHNAIHKQDLSFASPNYKIDFGRENVGSQFSRIDSLSDPDKALWGRELGLRREWANLQANVFGKNGQPLILSYDDLKGQSGFASSGTLSAGAKNWSLQVANIGSTQGFANLSANADATADSKVKAIAALYQQNIQTGPNERMQFENLTGVERTGLGFAAQPFKDCKLNFNEAYLRDKSDHANYSNFALTGKNFDLTYSNIHTGAQFGELPQLMGFEQQHLGTLAGIDRTDFGLNLRMKNGEKLNLAQTSVDATGGGAKRDTLAYTDKKLELNLASRQVDPGFNTINAMTDPEQAIFSMLLGFNEMDGRAKWQLAKNLQLAAFAQDVKQIDGQAKGFIENISLLWNPNQKTVVSFIDQQIKSTDPSGQVFKNLFALLDLKKDFGKYGQLEVSHQVSENQGTATIPQLTMAGPPPPPPVSGQVIEQGPATKDYVSYKAKLNATTTVQTEESQTRYSNGDKEDMAANTISTNLTKNVGVSYTDLRIDRPGTNQDEKKKNMGFWLDLGHGFRFSYGWARDLNQGQGTMNLTTSLSSGIWGPIKVNSLSYAENRWDEQHDQALSNIQLESSKPIKLGFLHDVQFKFGMDLAEDYSAWVHDNRLLSVSGKIGSNTLMYEVKSQRNQGNQFGSDRFFMFQTDQSEKKWLRASVKYKIRDLPNQRPLMIRDISFTARPVKNLEITNQLLTNPENQNRPDLLLGTLTDPFRVNRWKLDYHSGNDVVIGGTWEDHVDDSTNQITRLGGLSMEFFKTKASPLTLFYGIEQAGGSLPHQSAQRYWLRFDQKPGPHQSLSMFLGNVSYNHTLGDGFRKNNWSIHVDYQLHFW